MWLNHLSDCAALQGMGIGVFPRQRERKWFWGITYLALPLKRFLIKMASDGDLARSEFIASSLSELSNDASSLLGDGGWISTTVGHDMPLSWPESLLSVGVESEP